VCREFVMLCKKLDLLSNKLVAIDGSKFKAVNSRDKNFTRAKMKRRLADVESAIERYLTKLDEADAAEPASDDAETMKTKVEKLKEELARLKKLNVRMLEAPDKQLSLTDPDARSMNSRGSGVVGYNVQSAVDAKHHLIVAHEVTNAGSDRRQLSRMAVKAREALDIDDLEVVADRGYYNGDEIKACEDSGITAYLPKPLTSPNKAKGHYDRSRFRYIAEDDEYECPANERLIYRSECSEGGRQIRRYWSSACKGCSLKPQCTSGKERRMSRWVHEDVLERAEHRLRQQPEQMTLRRSAVEHPFGTIKSWMGSTHFQTRTIPKVSTEMSLQVLAYNMKRAIGLLGVEKIVATIKA